MHYLYYVVIFTTGLCSLVYQVVWQRYLHLLVGSEARSTTIIVAIFLLGLSIGYYLFGRLSLKYKERHQFLKFYGYVEVATGAYAILFPKLFYFINNSNLPNTSLLAVDIFVGLLLLLIPTILMGATVPVMTTVLPNSNDQVNRSHSLVYGVNTLGAFLGVLISSFFLIPTLGLSLTLTIVGGINFFCGLIYMGNRLDGLIKKQGEMPTISSHYKSSDIYLLAFTSGLVTISLEIIWIRVLGLTLGPSYIIFPIVLSLFILGLGMGSLSIKNISVKSLKRQYFILLGFLILSFITVPYLPAWFSNLRVSLASHSSSYYLFIVLVYLFSAILILTFVIPLGRLLPMSYAFLEKDTEKYGFNCGMLYFINTLGTFAGSVIFSYVLFYFFSMETIYKLNIFVLICTFCLLFFRDRAYRPIFISLICMIFLFSGLEWNRRYHIQGLFRNRTPTLENFRGLFEIMPLAKGVKVLDFQDGPNTTIAVTEHRSIKEGKLGPIGRSIFVNGKSDSSTVGDFSTLTMLGIIPYVFAGKNKNLNTVVIGQGTGVTAGLLGALNDVERVDQVEISPAVAKTLADFREYNYNAHENPKIVTHELDAFKFFRQVNKKYDVILSEPTNPWVVGVDNLYTPYFYDLISKNISDDGIFMQWMHLYAMDESILRTVFANASKHFKYVELYQTGIGDLGLIASKTRRDHKFKKRRLEEMVIQKTFKKLNLKTEDSIYLMNVFSHEEMRFITSAGPSFLHSIEYPILGMKAYKSFFQGKRIEIETLLSPFISRLLNYERQGYRQKRLEEFKKITDHNCQKLQPEIVFNLHCRLLKPFLDTFIVYKTTNDLGEKLQAYAYLRKEEFIRSDKQFLNKSLEDIISIKEKRQFFIQLIDEYLKEGWYQKTLEVINLGKNHNLLDRKSYLAKKSQVEKLKKLSKKLFNRSEWLNDN